MCRCDRIQLVQQHKRKTERTLHVQRNQMWKWTQLQFSLRAAATNLLSVLNKLHLDALLFLGNKVKTSFSSLRGARKDLFDDIVIIERLEKSEKKPSLQFTGCLIRSCLQSQFRPSTELTQVTQLIRRMLMKSSSLFFLFRCLEHVACRFLCLKHRVHCDKMECKLPTKLEVYTSSSERDELHGSTTPYRSNYTVSSMPSSLFLA